MHGTRWNTPSATPYVVALAAVAASACQPSPDHYMAERIVIALAPVEGERAVVRYDSAAMPDLPAAISRTLETRGVEVDLMQYGLVRDFAARLDTADIYIWLPDPDGGGTTAEQMTALGEWLDAGRGRQIHFHWGAGTVSADGMPGEHSTAYHEQYLDALAIDYEELDRHQDAAIALLRSGPVRITTPGGTDITFDIRDRPFNKQNGDASRRRMGTARTRIDREIELPAGVVRVAPIETSVNGTVVIPTVRFPPGEVRELTLQFTNGVVTDLSAAAGAAIARAALAESSALMHFRELGLGFNPVLRWQPGKPWIPYFGYGEGVVRLSLGNNEELGGLVGGDGVRWFFFTDATVQVERTMLVDEGTLVMVQHLVGMSVLGALRP